MDSAKSIKFSIIIPLYNKEQLIAETIESVLNQSYDNWELIIVDDESTDSSASIAKEYAKKNAKVHVVSQKNGGAYKARITGLKVATGDYVLCIDGDDVMRNDYLAKVYDCIVKSEPDMVLCQFSREPDLSKQEPDYTSIMSAENPCAELRNSLLRGDNFNSTYVKTVKRSVLDLNDIFITDPVNYAPLGEDKLLILFYMDGVKTLSVVNEPLYYFRQRQGCSYYVPLTDYVTCGFDKIYLLENSMLHYATKWYGADEGKRILTGFYRNQMLLQIYRALIDSPILKRVKGNFEYIKSLEAYKQSLKYYPDAFKEWKLRDFYNGHYLKLYAWRIAYKAYSKVRKNK